MILTAVNPTAAAIVGWIVVVAGVAALVLALAALGIFLKKKLEARKDTPNVVVEEAAEEEIDAPLAPGSAGQLKLHDVEPKTAAMLMAIVADKMGKPLNELHFISIKEVK